MTPVLLAKSPISKCSKDCLHCPGFYAKICHALSHHIFNIAAAAKSLQSCPTLCDPIDKSPSGSPIPGILQARTLEWVAISFSIAWKWKVKVKSLSCVRLVATPWTDAYQAPPSMGFSRQEYWSSLPLPSPIFNTRFCYLCFSLIKAEWDKWLSKTTVVAQLLSPIWLFCDSMSCSPSGSSIHGIFQAKIVQWVAISFSRGASWPRDRTSIFCIVRWIL